MSFRDDLDYLKANYPIFGLVAELQRDRGYTSGVVSESSDHDRKTRCPIHDDTDPSAKVYLATNSAYCWVCQRAWDPPGLYHAYHGTGLRDAVRVLLRRLGRAPTPDTGDRASLVELNTMIAELEAEAGAPVEPLRGWLTEIRGWAGDVMAAHPGRFPALEEVEDATWWAATLDADRCARAVRRVLAWAVEIHPDLAQYDGPVVEDPAAAYIAGVPPPTGED